MSEEVTLLETTNASECKQPDSDAADEKKAKEAPVEENKGKKSGEMAKISATGTDEESKSPIKIKQKRIVHNEVERRRKVKINNHIFTLAKLLPNKEKKKWSKNEVLTKAIEYIQEIKENHQKMLLGKMEEVQAHEFERMKTRIEELEKQNNQYVKLLEIAGFPPGATSSVRLHCDKVMTKIDPSTIIMDDDGEISVVSPSGNNSHLDNAGSNKRRVKSDLQSSPKKKANLVKCSEANGVVKKQNEEESVEKKPCETPKTTATTNVVSTKSVENVAPSVSSSCSSMGVTAVTHSLQGGPIMATSQSSPQLQQTTTTVVSQIPMLNFGGTVNLMQGAQVQPVLTINDQGIQVIQMMATPMNSGNSSTPNLLLTGNSAMQPAIDCTSGSLITTDSAGLLQQVGGSLIAQGTQYMSTTPQVHLMTNSPPVVSTTPNANTLLTLNSTSSSNQLPSALVLPNGQIISVMREPQLPLHIYQNQAASINGSLLMSTNPTPNSPCTVFNTATTISKSSPVTTTNVDSSEPKNVISTSTAADSASKNQPTASKVESTVPKTNLQQNNVENGVEPPKSGENSKRGTEGNSKNKSSGGKKKAKRSITHCSQRSIKPKPTSTVEVSNSIKSPTVCGGDKEPVSSGSTTVLPSVSPPTTTSTTAKTDSAADSVIIPPAGDSLPSNEVKVGSKTVVMTPPTAMTDILAQATESIFANSISDISNSPNPTYFNSNSGENVDFLHHTMKANTPTADPQQIGTKTCSMLVSNVDNQVPKLGREGRNSTVDILSDLVGEVYQSGANTLMTKRCNNNPEDEMSSVTKRNKLNSKLSTDDLMPASTTTTTTTVAPNSSSVSFLSVSQLASSASVNNSNCSALVTPSTCTVVFSNQVTTTNTSTMPFSIDTTANSADNSPLCSISPLLNSPNKSNDLFVLNPTISAAEEHTFANNNLSSNSEIPSSSSSGGNVSSTTTSTLTFSTLPNSFNTNNSLSNSSVIAPFTLPDLSNLNSNNGLDICNSYKAFSYQPNHHQSHRTNFNGMINFQANDSVGFPLPTPLTSPECFMDKCSNSNNSNNNKSVNFEYTPRSRQHPASRTNVVPITTSASAAAQFSSAAQVVQSPQFNHLQSYSSIPLSHPVSPRLNLPTSSPLNVDLNQSNEVIGCGSKNKSISPRSGMENNLAGAYPNSGCLHRSGSIHNLPGSMRNQIDQSVRVNNNHFSNNNNNNQRIHHQISRQSPQICAGNSPSPKSTSLEHQGQSPLNNHRLSGSSTTNISPKLSPPVGHSMGANSRSTSSSHASLPSPAAAFIHQRSPVNLDPPLITSFSTESITMQHNNNGNNNTRKESMFPPGQKQLTHPPLSSNSGVPPRASISYSAESLIQNQDNNRNILLPTCARETVHHPTSSGSNSVLSQHFMHASHLNKAGSNEENQQVGFSYFPFQQSGEQLLPPLKSNQLHSNHNNKSVQLQPNFSFSLMPTGEAQQQHVQDQSQQHQRHTNYLSSYGQVPGLDGMGNKDLQVARAPMAFSCMPPFPTTSQAAMEQPPNIRHRHTASFLTTTPTNREHFTDTYIPGQSSLTPGGVPLAIQGPEKTPPAAVYKGRQQNVNKQDGKLSKSKQNQALKKKSQQYQIEEVNLSNSIFETGRSNTPYFAIPNLSPPRNNEGPTYIPNPNPLFNSNNNNKRVGGKNNSTLTGSNSTKGVVGGGGDSYNTLFHTRTQPGFNLNFQTSSFAMNHLHGVNNNDGGGGGGSSAVNQPSHMNSPSLVTSSSSHVPNFNLSNIFPDINANNDISSIKFHSNHHILPPPPTPVSSQSTAVDGHNIQHTQATGLYHSNRSHHHHHHGAGPPPPPPPPPPVIHNGMTINSILSHSPHSFDGRPAINNGMTPWTWTSNIQ